MTGIETTLLIILAAGFGILLLLSIIVAFVIVRILQNVHHITQKAEATTDNVSATLMSLGKKFGPGVASAIIGVAVNQFKKRRNKKEDV